MYLCACVERKSYPFWPFKAPPPSIMFGNLRNRVKGGEKEREIETYSRRQFTIPLVCCTQCNMKSLNIILMMVEKLQKERKKTLI